MNDDSINKKRVEGKMKNRKKYSLFKAQTRTKKQRPK
jgi:hypothetical protein